MGLRVYQQLSTQTKALIWAGFWVVLYLVLVFALPPNAATMNDYHLSHTQYRILALVAGLPTGMVWVISFFGYATLTSYTEKVASSREGQAFGAIARGLTWLAWGLPIGSCTTTLLGGIARINPEFLASALIISHYVSLVISVVAFTYMSDGTRGLRGIVNKLPSKTALRALIGMAVILAVGYCSFTIRTVQNQHPNSYRLPLWLILLTIIIPYLYAWLMGLLAVFEISQYRRAIRGVFYKQALRLLGGGTTCVIVASVALQYLSSSSPYLRRINLNGTLLISYAVVITFALGFILIGAGANQLKKIEEV